MVLPTKDQIIDALESGNQETPDDASMGEWYGYLADEVLQLLMNLEHEEKIKTEVKENPYDRIDWASGNDLHQRFGHEKFVTASMALGKSDIFVWNVCRNQKCSTTQALPEWRDKLLIAATPDDAHKWIRMYGQPFVNYKLIHFPNQLQGIRLREEDVIWAFPVNIGRELQNAVRVNIASSKPAPFKWVIAPTVAEAERWALETSYQGVYKVITKEAEAEGARMREDNVVFVGVANLNPYLLERVQINILRSKYEPSRPPLQPGD